MLRNLILAAGAVLMLLTAAQAADPQTFKTECPASALMRQNG
jgi:hypothetical protein